MALGIVGAAASFVLPSGAADGDATGTTTPPPPAIPGAPPRGGARLLDPGGAVHWTNLTPAEHANAISMATADRRVLALTEQTGFHVDEVARWFDGEVTRTNIGAVVTVTLDRPLDVGPRTLLIASPALASAETGGRPYVQADDPHQYRGLTSIFVFVDLTHGNVARIKPGPGAAQLDEQGGLPARTTPGE